MRRLAWPVAAVASVLLLVALTTQQTGALWRDRTQLSGGILTSGRLEILANDTENFTWSAFGGTNLAQGSMVQQPLTISIDGDVDVRYRLHSVTPGSGDLPFTVTAWVVGSTSSCPTSSGSAAAAPGSPIAGPWSAFPAPSAGRTVSAGTAEVWCLRATVGDTAQQGRSTTLTFNFRAEQVA
ncbi:hypothetical protein [Rhodococcus rhodochrous]|uniref:hypothetical protein n=1 Tax=Rhodococcus rhodochrous TaxID=1829 RepID=UPI0011AE8089|nr:hypothetical protein [Rhodococcus rhodochrous]MCQ4136146.1 hypothetical protein [Rhodococcus rhodochrous]MCR8691514.1 hypothetical protein [Rhodococcus pyridinivorans]MDJ0017432.1 hypothetical protein [Rhodococcus rhodochrous]